MIPELPDDVLLGALCGPALARRLLRDGRGLADLAGLGDGELEALGVRSEARRHALRAAFELGRRAMAPAIVGEVLRAPADVARFFVSRIGHRPTEEFWSIALDARHRVRRATMHARGSLTGVEVHPRDVFRGLIREGAAAVIFAHNHPSGEPTPSALDVELTKRLRETGKLVGIELLDHLVVVADGQWASLREREDWA